MKKTEKTCIQCGATKEIEKFHESNYCNTCKNAIYIAPRRKNIQKIVKSAGALVVLLRDLNRAYYDRPYSRVNMECAVKELVKFYDKAFGKNASLELGEFNNGGETTQAAL